MSRPYPKLVTMVIPMVNDDGDFSNNIPSKSKELKARKKPSLEVPNCYRDLDKARNAWRSSLVNRKPDVVAAKEFIYYKLREHEEINTEKWESYGVVIAEQGEKVNPLCMYTVSTQDCEQIPVEADASDKYDISLLLYALGLYRLQSADNDKQISSICKEIHGHMTSLPGAPTLLQLIPERYSLCSDRNLGKLVAGIDMFLFRFPASPLAALRVGTRWARYQSCGGLTNILFFMKMIGIKEIEEVGKWLFTDHLGKELQGILRPGEEPGNENSYMPYMALMNLIGRGSTNAFSVKANTYLHYYVHAIGSLMGIQRSINARMTDVGCILDLNIKVVAYALKNFKTEIQERVVAEPPGPPANQEMYNTLEKAVKVFQKKRTIPDMDEKLQELKNNIVNPRQGTVGYHVKHNLM